MKILILFFSFIAMPFFAMAQADSKHSIDVFFQSQLASQYNLIGLELARIKIVNNTDSMVDIHAPAHIFFEAMAQDSNKWIRFYEGNLMLSSGRESYFLQPRETLSTDVNINFLDFARVYKENFDKIPSVPTKVKIRAGIHCPREKKKYYSEVFSTTVNPLSKKDAEAFNYLERIEQEPSRLTQKAWLTMPPYDSAIADSVITHHPESTFATLASLSLAYAKAREIKRSPESRSQVPQLLAKPLASPYSFVRYLAEELKKSLN